jgi:hypothetical protein
MLHYSCCLALIVLQQAAESRVRNYATLSSHPNSTARCFLAQSEVGAVGVVIANVIAKKSLEIREQKA